MRKTILVKILYFIVTTSLVIALPSYWQHYQEEHSSGGLTWYEYMGVDLDEKYQRAYDECIWISQLEPELYKRGVNKKLVSVAVLTKDKKEEVRLFGTESPEEFRKSKTEYWAFTMGAPLNYYVMVCNSKTGEVVGVIMNGDGWKKSPWGIEMAITANLDYDYWWAYCSCIDRIDRDPELKKLGLDKTEVSVETLTEDEKEKVRLFDVQYENSFYEEEANFYLVFTIGEPKNCCRMVACNSISGQAVGMVQME